MPSDFVLKALSYGVVGLCAAMLVVAWQVLMQEQRRQGQPRKDALPLLIVGQSLAVYMWRSNPSWWQRITH